MFDIVVIGGGLAGLVASIHLRKMGHQVLVIEKKKYPQHKVCGEYISNEVTPYLKSLGVDLDAIQPNTIKRFQLHDPNGKYVAAELDLGGKGIRRYTLDYLLFTYAQDLGVQFWLHHSVSDVQFLGDQFEITTLQQKTALGKVVLGGFGKRSGMDKALGRKGPVEGASYLGVKYYLDSTFPEDLVTLYNFNGGYCGAVQVENGKVDVAYLVAQEVFACYKDIEVFEEQVLFKNPSLKCLFKDQHVQREKPLTISNVSFQPKTQVDHHILLIGDAAGMIPPLAGNGMAMGIHAAKMACALIHEFLERNLTRNQMEQQFAQQWNNQFKSRLQWGRVLHRFMGKPYVSRGAVKLLQWVPGLLPGIVSKTHGKPF